MRYAVSALPAVLAMKQTVLPPCLLLAFIRNDDHGYLSRCFSPGEPPASSVPGVQKKTSRPFWSKIRKPSGFCGKFSVSKSEIAFTPLRSP